MVAFIAVLAPIIRDVARALLRMTAERLRELRRAYALAMSGNTASILVFSVAALNGLTM